MTIPSVILLIVGIFVFKRFYKLDDTRMEEIKSDVYKRQGVSYLTKNKEFIYILNVGIKHFKNV